jgi:hypothetical protein
MAHAHVATAMLAARLMTGRGMFIERRSFMVAG